jgi:hypothetical protein
VKCPECANDIASGHNSCECGWERSPGGKKRCTADGPRDLVAFQSMSVRFRLEWARDYGFYRDGGMAEIDETDNMLTVPGERKGSNE